MWDKYLHTFNVFPTPIYIYSSLSQFRKLRIQFRGVSPSLPRKTNKITLTNPQYGHGQQYTTLPPDQTSVEITLILCRSLSTK